MQEMYLAIKPRCTSVIALPEQEMRPLDAFLLNPEGTTIDHATEQEHSRQEV